MKRLIPLIAAFALTGALAIAQKPAAPEGAEPAKRENAAPKEKEGEAKKAPEKKAASDRPHAPEEGK